MATYTVKSGDSLSAIAQAVFGDYTRWPDIASANGISAPYTIFPNQVLQLPDDAGDSSYLTTGDEFFPPPAARAPVPVQMGPPKPLATPPGGAKAAFSWQSLLTNKTLWIGGGLAVLAWWFLTRDD